MVSLTDLLGLSAEAIVQSSEVSDMEDSFAQARCGQKDAQRAACLAGGGSRPGRMARREAERLRAVADYVRLTRCWREWRGRVDGARRLQALLQRTQAHLAGLREAQVCCTEVLTRQCSSQTTC